METHQQARHALTVALVDAKPCTRYADIALLTPWLEDPSRGRALIELYLSPLKDQKDGGTALRETLRAYLEADRNASSAASRLRIDEMWLTWHSKPGWVETGEEAEPAGCGCTLYPFFAQNTNKNHYAEYVSPVSITGPTNNGYRILSNSSHNGAWEIYWELPNGTGYKYIQSVKGEYSWYSIELQAGMEAATSTAPTNWESNQVRAEYFEGTWHPWVGRVYRSEGNLRSGHVYLQRWQRNR